MAPIRRKKLPWLESFWEVLRFRSARVATPASTSVASWNKRSCIGTYIKRKLWKFVCWILSLYIYKLARETRVYTIIIVPRKLRRARFSNSQGCVLTVCFIRKERWVGNSIIARGRFANVLFEWFENENIQLRFSSCSNISNYCHRVYVTFKLYEASTYNNCCRRLFSTSREWE